MAQLSVAAPSAAAPRDAAPSAGRLWRRLGFGLLGTAGFVILLAFMAPAGVVPRVLHAAGVPARLMAVEGRLYTGSGNLLVGTQPLGRLSWQLQPGALLRGQLGLHGALSAAGHELQGELHTDLGGRHLALNDLHGEIDKASFGPLLRPYNIDVPGTLQLQDIALRATRNGSRLALQDASGELLWDGGRIVYELGGRLYTATLPPLRGEMQATDGTPSLRVTTAAGAALLAVDLNSDGWATIRVHYRLLELTGQGYANPPPADSVVLELQEQLF